jgi:hypothetical protein
MSRSTLRGVSRSGKRDLPRFVHMERITDGCVNQFSVSGEGDCLPLLKRRNQLTIPQSTSYGDKTSRQAGVICV